MGLVVDSSVLIEAERASRSGTELFEHLITIAGDQDLVIAVVTVTELEHGLLRAQTESQRSRRAAFIDSILDSVPIAPFGIEAARMTARVDVETRRAGYVVPLGDLIIAATSRVLDYAVITHNRRHFGYIPGIRLLDWPQGFGGRTGSPAVP